MFSLTKLTIYRESFFILSELVDIKKNVKKPGLFMLQETAEAVVQGCSVKEVFSEILQNSQENTCARVSF